MALLNILVSVFASKNFNLPLIRLCKIKLNNFHRYVSNGILVQPNGFRANWKLNNNKYLYATYWIPDYSRQLSQFVYLDTTATNRNYVSLEIIRLNRQLTNRVQYNDENILWVVILEIRNFIKNQEISELLESI